MSIDNAKTPAVKPNPDRHAPSKPGIFMLVSLGFVQCDQKVRRPGMIWI